MLKRDLIDIARMMNRTIMEMADEGELEPGEYDTATFFGFSPEDVDGIHTHKIGVGDGVWYRLKDGRVFNAYGEECEPNSSIYDTLPN
jgi:hypothetical protein